eukprot:TRINITY_DN5101_c0_g1_i1.p1 TRINITY_DN5101_c0_g1~~TRINITY_DN5101_c0_g1_i1.p1  ORF type:complete len:118 (+),score=14.82 TRINITY_DN5101_c0_g1_i1:224-577(+)
MSGTKMVIMKEGVSKAAQNVSYSDLESHLEELSKEHSDKAHIVFGCMWGKLRSTEAALNFINKSKATENNVFVMAGGIRDFIMAYHDDPELVENFDRKSWSDDFYHVHDTEGTPRLS